VKNVKTILIELERGESKALVKYPRLLQIDNWAFSLLRCRITFYAAEKIEEEWNLMKLEVENSLDNVVKGSLPCQCYILLRFGLPCRHYLQRSFISGEAIPRSLVHPRYWLRGPTIHPRDWKPFWQDNNDISQSQRLVAVAAVAPVDTLIATIRAELQPEEKARFEAQILREQEKLVEIGQRHLALQSLPMGLPDALPRPSGRRKRTQGGSRLMTGPEVAAVELKARERLAKQAVKGKTIEIVRDEDITVINQAEQVGSVPIQPAIPPQHTHKRNHSVMVNRTPPARASSPLLLPSPSPSPAPAPAPIDFDMPASTAPVAMGRRNGRINQRITSQQDWRATLIPKKRGGKK
jgi:hypothetical protein